jgi:TRAP-type C4-dicarboxylate transport system permease small subunit
MNGGAIGGIRILLKIDRALVPALKWSSVACLVALLVLIAAGIFVRFVPIGSMGWADEVIEWAFVYMVFMGSVVLWRERSHFRVELVPHWLAGTRGERVLEVALGLLSLIFFLVFTYEGFLLTLRTTDNSPILDLPKILWYGIMPISGGVFLGYTVRDLLLLFRGRSLSSSQ